MQPRGVDAGALLDDGSRPLRCARAEKLGRRIDVLPSATPLVDADPMRLEQALGNLVDNALDARRTEPSLCGHATQASTVELHVGDEGRGFPPDSLDRAFDRFSRADDARTTPGTGLGLAIVALIARAHGGEAGIGPGADVWLSVPLREVPARPEAPVRALAE